MTEQFKTIERREQEMRGKSIAVVGASSGLGLALSEQLAGDGAHVFLLSRSIADRGIAFGTPVPCNLGDPESIKSAFETIDQEDKGLDILINCAGINMNKPFEETTYDEIIDTLGTNLKGIIFTSHEAYRRMKAQGNGHIINVSSTTGLKAREMETIYAASKWGLRGFTESLRLEAKSHGIRVSGVYPGGMRTAFWDGSAKDISGYMDPALVAGQIANILRSDPSMSPSEIVIERS